MPTELILKQVSKMGNIWQRLFNELRIHMGKQAAYEYLLEIRKNVGLTYQL